MCVDTISKASRQSYYNLLWVSKIVQFIEHWTDKQEDSQCLSSDPSDFVCVCVRGGGGGGRVR